ncbi:DUF4124 domain-containing protein [Marinicella rhabdoformis]|uniref:DUF4124 domain-containing protein n=1 Tax=Marinicella rhabdoformis TaxID=2580566 RepID=UPI0012AEDE77|nr:DUF4124 domain-containing protein [Marinicella rhabdoformis]
MNKLLLIGLIFLSSTATSKQKFYKWVDEEGNTHYSAEKPENQQTDEVKVSNRQPKVAQAMDVAEKPQIVTESEEEPEKSYLEQRRENKQKAKETALKNQKQCQKARYTIKKYQQQVRMSRMDPKTGKKVFLDDDKRASIIKKAKQSQRKYCR